MSWRAITEADIAQKLSDSEMEKLRAAGLGNAGSDSVGGAIIAVMNAVRGYIRASGTTKLGPEGTIPETLIDAACDLLVPKICSRVAGIMMDPKGLRKQAAADARATFKEVAARTIIVEDPQEYSGDPAAGQVPAFGKRRRRYTRRDEDGI
jgi:hypothetical protein